MTDWLLARGLLEERCRVSRETHAQYLALRGAIWEQLGVNVGTAAAIDVLEAAEDVLRALPVREHLRRPADPGPWTGAGAQAAR